MGRIHAKGNLPFPALVTDLVAAAGVPRETKDRRAMILMDGDVVPNGRYLYPPVDTEDPNLVVPMSIPTTSTAPPKSSMQRIEDLHKKLDRYER
ncbi:hypothetical protein AHAS_Ahas11G0198200 [Arachis hypogaea]